VFLIVFIRLKDASFKALFSRLNDLTISRFEPHCRRTRPLSDNRPERPQSRG
jgi:hypothetical protein